MSKERTESLHALKQAQAASRRGDYRDAERWSKTAERLAEAAERVAALPPDPDDEEEAERARAEIRARIARFVEADAEVRRWEWERDVHAEYAERAAREGLPPAPPLRPCPFSGQDLERVARGELVPHLMHLRQQE